MYFRPSTRELWPHFLNAAKGYGLRLRLKCGPRPKDITTFKTQPKVSILGRVLNAATVLTLGHVLNGAIGPGLGPQLKSAALDRPGL